MDGLLKADIGGLAMTIGKNESVTTDFTKGGNDKIQTPDNLAMKVVAHFCDQMTGRILEPCCGEGAFVRALKKLYDVKVIECEIDRGTDFFDYKDKVDWIVTNPPWSLARKFAQHGYGLAENIIFLINVGHFLGFRARMRDTREAGFGVKEVLLVDTPPSPWPQSGFQLGAVHFQKGWHGATQLTWGTST